MKTLIKKFLDILGIYIARNDNFDLLMKRKIVGTYHKNSHTFLNYVNFAKQIDGDDFFILQVGACDGVIVDPIYPYIKKHNPRALLIEPVPGNFEKLKNNYRGETNVILHNVAIDESNGKRTMYLRKNQKIKWWASFDKRQLTKQGIRDDNISEIEVSVNNFETIFNNFGIGNVSVLVVDAEGYDVNIINQFISFRDFEPIIFFENMHADVEDYIKLIERLSNKGYEFLVINYDTLCIPRAVFSRESSCHSQS